MATRPGFCLPMLVRRPQAGVAALVSLLVDDELDVSDFVLLDELSDEELDDELSDEDDDVEVSDDDPGRESVR